MLCIHKKTGAEAPAALGEEVYERHDRLDQLCHYDNERSSSVSLRTTSPPNIARSRSVAKVARVKSSNPALTIALVDRAM